MAGGLRSIASRADELLRGSGQELSRVADEVQSFAGLLRREPRLRAALTDISVGGEAKRGLLGQLLGERAAARTVEVLGVLADELLAPEELDDALGNLAVRARMAAADADGSLEDVEDELFRFARVIDAQPDLRSALTDPGVEPDAKASLVQDLLRDRANQHTLALTRFVLEQALVRDPAQALTDLAELAAERRGRVVVEARTAVPIDVQRRARLQEALSRVVGRGVDLEVVVDPEVVGGVVARVGDEVIDGSVKRKLELALEELTG